MAAIPVRSSGARPPLHLLDTDSDLLGDLALRAEHRFPVVAAMLLAEIERAEIHDADTLPEDAITLGSEIEYLDERSEEHTSELQSLMRISYAVFCLKKKK